MIPAASACLNGLRRKGGKQLVFLAGGLIVPFAVPRPVGVGLGIRLDRVDEASLVDTAHRKHDGDGHHLVLRRLPERRPGARRNIRIPGSIDDALGQNCLPTRLALTDDTGNDAAFKNRCDAETVQQWSYSSLLDQRVGNPFEHFRIERMTEGLRLRHGRAHGRRPLLELDTNPFAIDRLLVAVPGKSFNAYLSDVAAEATVAVNQCRTRAGASGSQGRCKAPGTAAHHQDIRLQHHID